MRCPNCGAEAYSSTCEYCGTVVQQAMNMTSQNITINNISNVNNNAVNYGRPTRIEVVYKSPKSRGLAIFLCCLSFLGLAGMHRFYVGKKSSGWFHLFTLGFVWIGTIIDLISLSRGTFTDSYGRILA